MVWVFFHCATGLFRDSTSNGFIIDDTPPALSRGPVFSKDIGVDGKTQFYRTLIKVEWDVGDEESYIEKQYVSLRSHLGGDFDLPSAEVFWCRNRIDRNILFMLHIRQNNGIIIISYELDPS